METSKVLKKGSEDGKFVQVETETGDKWVEINPTDGTIVREIKPRHFVEYDDTGKIIAVHNITYSQMLETQGVNAFMMGKKGFEVTDEAIKALDGKELLEKYSVTEGILKLNLIKEKIL